MASTKRSLIKVLLFVHLVSLVSAGGLFGNDGAEVEGDSNRVQRPEDLLAESGKVWIVTVKGINEEKSLSSYPRVATLLNGSASLIFTKEKNELVRSRKNIVHFSTGETGYWRIARAMKGSSIPSKKTRTRDHEDAKKPSLIKRYEDAVLSNPTTEILEIEVLLNQPNKIRHRYRRNVSAVQGSSADTSHQGPVLVYQIPVAFGRVQRGSLVNDVPGVLRFVSGEVVKNDIGDFCYSDLSDVMENKAQAVGRANLKLGHGRGLVDPLWARGRQWFFCGRSKGNF